MISNPLFVRPKSAPPYLTKGFVITYKAPPNRLLFNQALDSFCVAYVCSNIHISVQENNITFTVVIHSGSILARSSRPLPMFYIVSDQSGSLIDTSQTRLSLRCTHKIVNKAILKEHHLCEIQIWSAIQHQIVTDEHWSFGHL